MLRRVELQSVRKQSFTIRDDILGSMPQSLVVAWYMFLSKRDLEAQP